MAREASGGETTRRSAGVGEAAPSTAEGRAAAKATRGAPSAAGGRKSKAAAAAKAPTAKAATPWGPAAVVEEIKVAQRAGDKRFASVVQLLRDARGETLVRIAYTTDGVARRGPVTLRLKDIERLRAAAADGSPLTAALGWRGGEA